MNESILAQHQLKSLSIRDLVCCIYLAWLGIPLRWQQPGISDRDALRTELNRREFVP